jgi:hypothetical protein
MDKDLWVIKDIEKLLILEKDGSYTINVNSGEITVGEKMDVYKLADECEDYSEITFGVRENPYSKMLRQQAKEIEELKKAFSDVYQEYKQYYLQGKKDD